MPYICEKCGKGKMTGMNVSHSHRRTKRIFLPNLQNVTVVEGVGKKHKRLCTRCIRSLYKPEKTKKIRDEAPA